MERINGYRDFFFLNNERVLGIDSGDGYKTLEI